MKTGPSPKRGAKDKGTPLPEVPPYPTGNERPSGSNDQPNYGDKAPETSHEPKGKAGRPKNKPEHDVPYDSNTDVSYWMRQPAEYIKRQAFKRGLDPNKVYRTNGKPWTKPYYQEWMKEWLEKEAKKKK